MQANLAHETGNRAHAPAYCPSRGSGQSNSLMNETQAVDALLAQTVRSLRSGVEAAWPEDANHESDKVWSRIDFHGIASFLHDCADFLTGWPQDLLDRIAEEARLMGLWEATHKKVVAGLLADLEKAGVESLLMKGTVLAYSLYSEPAARRRGDSDILINPEDLESARKVLKGSGWYRAKDPHGLYFQEGWLHDAAGFFAHAVDLHWEASDRPVVQRLLPRADFFARRQPLQRFGEQAFATDPAHTMLHCAINQAWHVAHGYWVQDRKVYGARRLIWSVDFDLLVNAMTPSDWENLVGFCEKHGAGPLVAEALRGAEQDLQTVLPEAVMTTLEGHSLHPDVAQCLAVSNGFDEFWHDLKTANSWQNRWQMVRTRGLPPRSHLIDKYPDKAAWPTALLQARLLLETAGRALRRVVAS